MALGYWHSDSVPVGAKGHSRRPWFVTRISLNHAMQALFVTSCEIALSISLETVNLCMVSKKSNSF